MYGNFYEAVRVIMEGKTTFKMNPFLNDAKKRFAFYAPCFPLFRETVLFTKTMIITFNSLIK